MPNKLDNLREIEKQIEEIRGELDQIYSSIYWLDAQRGKLLKILSSPTQLQKAAFGKVAWALKDTTTEELTKNAELALSKSLEFGGLTDWHGGLISACSNLLTVNYYGNTAKNLRIEIDLNSTAGTIEEYGNAVKAARKEFSVGSSPKVASTFWKNWIYKVAREGMKTPSEYRKIQNEFSFTFEEGEFSTYGEEENQGEETTADSNYWASRYWETMNLRKEAFQSKAPWWELLDKGSFGVEMPSDWGGTPYPVSPPTHFVADTILFAEKKAKELGRGYIKRYKEDIERIISDYGSRIRSDGYWASELEEKLAKLLEQLEPLNIITRLIKEQAKKQEERKNTMADPDKINALAENIVNNVSVGRTRVGGGVRIRLVETIRKFEAELAKLSGE